jgi:hypothetical protein
MTRAWPDLRTGDGVGVELQS